MKKRASFLAVFCAWFSVISSSPGCSKAGKTEPIHQQLHRGAPREIAAGVLEQFDANHDDKLNRIEYTRATLAIFESLDKNHDDTLVDAEVSGFLKDKEFDQADRNADAQLTVNEAMQHQSTAFDEKDLDRNGFLEINEIEKSIEKKQHAQVSR